MRLLATLSILLTLILAACASDEEAGKTEKNSKQTEEVSGQTKEEIPHGEETVELIEETVVPTEEKGKTEENSKQTEEVSSQTKEEIPHGEETVAVLDEEGSKVEVTYDKNTGSFKFNGISLNSTQQEGLQVFGNPNSQSPSEIDDGIDYHYSFPDSMFSEELLIAYQPNQKVSALFYSSRAAGASLPEKEFLHPLMAIFFQETQLENSGVHDQYILVSKTNQVLFITILPDTSSRFRNWKFRYPL